MSTRFHLDLLHPGSAAQTWQEWFVGPRGVRRLALFSLGCAAVLVLVLAAVLPAYWRLSSDLSAVPRLTRDLAAQEADLSVLRSNVQSLAEEAQRQVRWADLLTAIGQQIPSMLKLQLVEAVRSVPPPAPGRAPGAGGRGEATLRIDAMTPLRPGSPTLLEVAQFMAGLMRDPVVNRRFQLKSWEMKPAGATDGVPLLSVSIVLAERTP